MALSAEKSAESLMEARVIQLQQISKRRNDLLREMYQLIQKRDNLGSVISAEEGIDDGLESFLERFDLQKYPETGHIANLLEDEVALHDTPPEYSPVGGPELELAPEPVSEGVPHVVVDSPMSEPSASPPTETREEDEGPRGEATIPQPDVLMEVDETTPAPPVERPEVPPSQVDASQDILSPESSQEPQTAPQSPVVTREELHLTEESGLEKTSPTPERLPTPPDDTVVQEPPVAHSPMSATREPSTSRLSPPREERSSSTDLRLAHDETSVIKAEPLDDEVMEDSGVHTQKASTVPVQEVDIRTPAVSAPTQMISQERSEDQIMDILGPSQPRSSPVPADIGEHLPAVNYSIPLPAVEPSVSFSFAPEPNELMSFEESSEPPAPFGPDPPYSLPPMTLLPIEFSRRKMSKRKRDKERGEVKEWQPMPLNKWAVVLKANPVHTRLAKASKVLSTRDWSVGMAELRLIRVFDRIEKLKEDHGWGFRQPRKQRGLGGLMKTHWDYLLDEMKWMRTDFREERRWKLTLAYTLAHAVVEWHEAGSPGERVRRGIVVLWKRPPPEDTDMADASEGEQVDGPFTQDTDENGVESRETGTPVDGYASDDESDDEQDKDAIESLEPESALQDALQQLEDQENGSDMQSDGVALKPKVEEIEDLTALKGRSVVADQDESAMDVDGRKPSQSEAAKSTATGTSPQGGLESYLGLKSSSRNPVLGVSGRDGEVTHGKTKHKISQFAAIRDNIVYSDVNKLFVDLDDLDLVKGMSELSTDEPPAAFITTPSHAPHDLAAIFPDLQPFGMLDVAPPSELRKKSERKSDRDDPNKRAEDVTYTKLTPVNKFMFVKPALIGTVKPATHFKDGHWTHIEPTPVFADVEVPPARPVDENICSLFEGAGNKPNMPTGHSMLPAPPRDVRKRNADHHNEAVAWTPAEDVFLKQAVDKYLHNWNLIADMFNSSRVTISTDRRTPWECMERWKEKFSAQARAEAAEENTQAAASSSSASHMTTRKRTASQAIASGSGSANSATPNEPRKRRRHSAMHDTLRKAAKRREAVQKSNAAPRQKASAVHDTHGQFTKLPRYTPAELSRMKADKEHAIREQHRGPPNTQPQAPQMLPQGATPNGVARTPNGVPQAQIAQQLRAQPQVGISQSQQQRMAAHLATTRMSPPHISATQAANIRAFQAQMQVQGQVQAGQGQVPGQAQVPQTQVTPVSNASAALTAAAPALSAAHLSPSFAARATSSSPGVPQQSPPLPAASPVNANAVQHPPSAPGQPVQGVPVNPLLHMSNMASVAATQYYMQMQNLSHGLQGRVTPEQIQALLAQQMRHQQQQQQQQQPQQQQYAAAHVQAQNSQNPNFPHQ